MSRLFLSRAKRTRMWLVASIVLNGEVIKSRRQGHVRLVKVRLMSTTRSTANCSVVIPLEAQACSNF